MNIHSVGCAVRDVDIRTSIIIFKKRKVREVRNDLRKSKATLFTEHILILFSKMLLGSLLHILTI